MNCDICHKDTTAGSLVTRGRRFKVHICPNCLMWSDDTRAVIAREYNQRRQNLYIYIPKRGYIRDLNYNCSELLYTDKEHEAKVFTFIDGIHGVLSYMKLVKNAGVTLPDYYIVTNGVKEQVAKIHF